MERDGRRAHRRRCWAPRTGPTTTTWTTSTRRSGASRPRCSRELRVRRRSACPRPTPVNDGSSYRVVALPDGEPNDADRALVANPADSLASPFGWHDTNGAAGAEYSTTTRATTSTPTWTRTPTTRPTSNSSPRRRRGAEVRLPDRPHRARAELPRRGDVTNLFYANNMIHDLLYRYGFDEASGNFQANNYGRGGTGGDYVRAEAADGNGTNNANFSTPAQRRRHAADADVPVAGRHQFGAQNVRHDQGQGRRDATRDWSRFTPAPTKAGLPTGTLVYGGTGCTPRAYPTTRPAEELDRGRRRRHDRRCPYLQRVQVGAGARRQGGRGRPQRDRHGADAHRRDDRRRRSRSRRSRSRRPTAPRSRPRSPRARRPATLAKNPAHPGIRDGDLENGIIIHEYAHGVSSRLTGGPGINCLSGNEQAGEGWSDYLAITLLMDPTLDDPDGPRGMGPYALFQADRARRRHPPAAVLAQHGRSSRSPTTRSRPTAGSNGASLALPHGLGHGWASVLWDLNWDLIDKYGFNREPLRARGTRAATTARSST